MNLNVSKVSLGQYDEHPLYHKKRSRKINKEACSLYRNRFDITCPLFWIEYTSYVLSGSSGSLLGDVNKRVNTKSLSRGRRLLKPRGA